MARATSLQTTTVLFAAAGLPEADAMGVPLPELYIRVELLEETVEGVAAATVPAAAAAELKTREEELEKEKAKLKHKQTAQK